MTERPTDMQGAAADERSGAAPGPGEAERHAGADGGAAGVDDAAAERSELERVVGERDQYLDALQRLKAEFENYRKRNERERQTIATGAVREVVRGLLPVMDNLERAVIAAGERADVPGGEGIVAGIEMVRGQLAGILAGHGVEEIPAHGEAFDPTVHEAIAAVPSPAHEEGTVVEVVEKGYRQEEHVLRPTRVVIAAAPPQG
ncbi:nucleotide exchange factor GrpE [Miltoncostaea marina]|uniref:nucleotide exchange factor GrpE n=1 Tax=Miltoncostaea marina TaxID=2843215 RepID=UPI001C3E02B8|nr:nucleotide exchange factor GrpE [Miltoncostaea marina]